LAWSGLGNASASLTLSNAGFGTEFDQTSAVIWAWKNTTASTSTVAQSSPSLKLSGTYWNGSASIEDYWTIQNIVNNGTNGTSALTITHTGSPNAGGYGGVISLGANTYYYDVPIAGALTIGANKGSSIYKLYCTQAQFQLNNVFPISWSATSNANATQDVGLSRVSAGVLGVGNGTQGNASGTLNAAKLIENATLSPTSAATAGTTGQIAWDSGNIYVCTAGGVAGAATWKAASLAAV
jgi:hypothetical protein